MNDAESGLCFIDSNVWLYAFIQTQAQDKTVKAKTLVQNSQVVISSQVNEKEHRKKNGARSSNRSKMVTLTACPTHSNRRLDSISFIVVFTH